MRDAGRRPSRTPALEAWRAELAAGERSAVDFDPLWRAACCDQWSADFLSWGLPTIAAAFREDARRILMAAAREEHQQRGQP
jgi:hypothetical protein